VGVHAIRAVGAGDTLQAGGACVCVCVYARVCVCAMLKHRALSPASFAYAARHTHRRTLFAWRALHISPQAVIPGSRPLSAIPAPQKGPSNAPAWRRHTRRSGSPPSGDICARRAHRGGRMGTPPSRGRTGDRRVSVRCRARRAAVLESVAGDGWTSVRAVERPTDAAPKARLTRLMSPCFLHWQVGG
jgi:hypothetical protein